MGRKVRYIAVMLMTVLLLGQQAKISYADDNAEKVESIEKENGKEESGETEEDKENADGSEGSEEPENPDGSENPEEPEKPIKAFEVKFSKEDGKNGYYRTIPEVLIKHNDNCVVTKFKLMNDKLSDEEENYEEILNSKNEEITIPKERFSEGKNHLLIWMEDKEGEKIEKTEYEKEFLIDICPPEIQMTVPAGFDTWYRKAVIVSSHGKDSVSGMEKLTCSVEGGINEEVLGKEGDFYISTVSNCGKAVPVMITAEDKAGNKSEKIQSVYVDNQAPHTRIKGAEEYTITSQPVTINYEIEEDNILQEFNAKTEWENVHGKKKSIPVEEWKESNVGKTARQTFTEDGIYKIRLNAADRAGYSDENSRQFIIDKENPIIQHVDELDRCYLKKFSWDYPQEEVIKDFTTYTYEIQLDGKLYQIGEKVTTEGKHKLEVKARDAAGNEAVATASFVIDHTKPEILFTDIKDGEEYEEERTFRVALSNPEDEIESIQINGKNQNVNSRSKAYQYTLNECEDYEVKVRAKDKTGNMSEKSIFFKIVPKETLVQKVVKPLRNTFVKEKQEKPQNVEERQEEDTNVNIWGVIVIGTGIVMGVGGCWMYKRRK